MSHVTRDMWRDMSRVTRDTFMSYRPMGHPWVIDKCQSLVIMGHVLVTLFVSGTGHHSDSHHSDTLLGHNI